MSRVFRPWIASGILSSLTMGAPVLAQDTIDPRETIVRDDLAADFAPIAAEAMADDGAVLVAEGGPSDRSMAGFRRPSINFDSEQEETKISFALSFDLQESQPGYQTGQEGDTDRRYRYSRTRIGFNASAPIEEGQGFGGLFQGDTLVTGTSLRLSLSRLTNTLGNGAGSQDLITRAMSVCIDEEVAQWSQVHAGAATEVGSFREGFRDYISAGQSRNSEDALTHIQSQAGASPLANEVYRQCVPGAPGNIYDDDVSLVRDRLPGQEISRYFYDDNSILRFYGIEGTAGTDSYSFLDSDAFELTETNRTSWEVSAYYGFITSDSNHSFRVKAVYGQGWELPDETELCRTFLETMEEQCLMGAEGQPVSMRTGIFSVESRHRLEFGDGQQFAIAPQATYRLEDDSFGVEVPIYLSPDDDGNLTGGIKFGYNTRDDDIAVGLFVGVPFSTLF